jgi:hypothetical protein
MCGEGTETNGNAFITLATDGVESSAPGPISIQEWTIGYIGSELNMLRSGEGRHEVL